MHLPEGAKNALRERKITEGHARAILALKNSSELQDELLSRIIKEGLSVRQAEAFVNLRNEKLKKKEPISTNAAKKLMQDSIVKRLSGLQQKLGKRRLHTKCKQVARDVWRSFLFH